MKFNIDNIKNILKKPELLTIFDINYTDEEINTMQNFNITNFDNFFYFGSLGTKFKEKSSMYSINKIHTFIKNIGNNKPSDILILKNIINKLINTLLLAYQKKYFWIDIRVQDSNHIRWHTDGKFFNRDNETKFVTTLHGKSTLIVDPNDKILIKYKTKEEKEYKLLTKDINNLSDNEFEELKEKDNELTKKYELIYKEKLKNIIQPTNTQGVIFKPDAVHHSEPCTNEPRIFISILVGDKNEIYDLKKRYK